MEDGEKKSFIYEVGSWLWGTVQGGFNEKQRTSQIIVDAAIGMIPVVGDITAARDLIALLIHMSDQPELRKSKLAWLQLVLLVFALIPVAGGLVKGVGKLILKEGGHGAELLRDVIAILNRMGKGDSLRWFRALDVRQYEALLLKHFAEVTSILKELCEIMAAELPRFGKMVERLESWGKNLDELAKMGNEKIPVALKDLYKRLKVIQGHLHSGTWADVGTGIANLTREAEARLVTVVNEEGKATELWKVEGEPFPSNRAADYDRQKEWPDLSEEENAASGASATSPPQEHKTSEVNIAPFSGPMKAVWLPPGTTIYRIIDQKASKAGRWWVYTLPENGRAWRHGFAVLEDWNKNGFYVELVVPEGGLFAWEGKTASQVDNNLKSVTRGQFLEGGEVQLFIDFQHASNVHALPLAEAAMPKPTQWSGHLGVNLPNVDLGINPLGPLEVAPKITPLDDTAHLAGGVSRLSRTLEPDVSAEGD